MATETTTNAEVKISTQFVRDSFWNKLSGVLFGKTACDESDVLKDFIVEFISTKFENYIQLQNHKLLDNSENQLENFKKNVQQHLLEVLLYP